MICETTTVKTARRQSEGNGEWLVELAYEQ